MSNAAAPRTLVSLITRIFNWHLCTAPLTRRCVRKKDGVLILALEQRYRKVKFTITITIYTPGIGWCFVQTGAREVTDYKELRLTFDHERELVGDDWLDEVIQVASIDSSVSLRSTSHLQSVTLQATRLIHFSRAFTLRHFKVSIQRRLEAM